MICLLYIGNITSFIPGNKKTTMNKTLSIIALIFSLVALLTAGLRTVPQSTSPQFSNLEEAHSRLLKISAASSESVVGMEADSNIALESKLDALAEKQAELEELAESVDQYGILKSLENEVQKAYDTLMDDSLSLGVRLKQIGQLKKYGQFDDQAIATVKDIWNETDSSREKSGILSALDGVIDSGFRDPILAALNEDLTAIKSLEQMLPDPAVEEWLNYLNVNDPEPKLRGRAASALGLEDVRKK